jgi:hypothetical protein
MATQKIPGRGLWLPEILRIGFAPNYSGALLIDASGEKAAMVGRFFHKSGTAKNISGVGFRFGSVTKGASTDIQVSLQDVNATDAFPDEVADQSANVGNANITANTWREVTLGSARASVAPGTLLAVVWEYSTFNASDSVQIGGVTGVGGGADINQGYGALKSGAGPTWAVISTFYNNLVLVCDDGSYGSFEGALITSALNTHTYNSSSNPDEYALIWNVPFPCIMDAAWVLTDMDGDLDVVLYDGTTAMTNGTVSADKDNRVSTVARVHIVPFGAHITLSANHDYYLALKPSTTTSLNAYSFDVNTAA